MTTREEIIEPNRLNADSVAEELTPDSEACERCGEDCRTSFDLSVTLERMGDGATQELSTRHCSTVVAFLCCRCAERTLLATLRAAGGAAFNHISDGDVYNRCAACLGPIGVHEWRTAYRQTEIDVKTSCLLDIRYVACLCKRCTDGQGVGISENDERSVTKEAPRIVTTGRPARASSQPAAGERRSGGPVDKRGLRTE
jgi:hypothetical protein